MPFDPAQFETLGQFYLGRQLDADTGKPLVQETPLLYDASDLTTHAVCVGMTGSGKTGLGVALLEEAAIDGIPALIVDPKGDLTNLALQFPKLDPADFQPWASPDAANRAGMTVEAYAASQAELWRKGLARWGQDGERIARLQKSAEVVVYTPGSTAGIPVSVIGSLECPPPQLLEDAELFSTHVETTVASLLALIGQQADVTHSREGVFLSALLHDAWEKGESPDLEELVRRIQQPPVQKIGVLDVETFYPQKDRFQLVLSLNNLLASPGFAVWREGVPLDVGQLLYTPEGKPRLAVFSIAHLGDAQRMFFVSMLLGATLAWMRRQSGTTSLRALFYMDEIFGYFPPTANPPSKKPLLTMMKQARAFGLGVVLATQNPADLDYKGLSNAGTWLIGRLQTERDKLRLLDGLAGLGVDRARVDAMLGRLGKRVFLMNNVHESEPVLFESRWALSYLYGPMTREQIRQLPRPSALSAPVAVTPVIPVRESAPVTLPETTGAAPLVTGVRQIYPRSASQGARLAPVLIGLAKVRFRDVKAKLDLTRETVINAPFPSGLEGVEWEAGLSLDDFSEQAPKAVFWGELPPEGMRAKSYDGWKRDLAHWLVDHQTLRLFECESNGMLSEPDEEEHAFRLRLRQSLREERDLRMAQLRERYGKREEALKKRLQSAEERERSREAQAGESRMQTVISVGSTLLSMLFGRKRLSATTVSKAATAARGVSRSVKKGSDLNAAREQIETIRVEIDELEAALQKELLELSDQLDPLSVALKMREIRPTRTGTRVEWVALGWEAS